jgi:hypothetical protein
MTKKVETAGGVTVDMDDINKVTELVQTKYALLAFRVVMQIKSSDDPLDALSSLQAYGATILYNEMIEAKK